MIESGTLLQDRYLIEKQIGEGGMGAVYVAIDRRFGSQVAIKETFYKDAELSAAFEREAYLLNSLHHPVLPHVSDFFAENNGYFLVMQFIEGEDLFEILKREGSFPVKDVLRWTDSLLDALDYLHSQEHPIIHRDIKPQNLKITTRGDIILLDFGLAKLNSEDTTGVKSIFGYSRKYSPLEQIQGTGTDTRSDIFSLAATAYHLMTGKPAIEVIARASEIIHGNPDPLRLASDINSEVSVSVANVLNSALALNAAKRFASAKAMRQALEHAVNSIPNESAEAILPLPETIEPNDYEIDRTASIENFTALESFAAANDSSKNDDHEKLPIEILIAKPETAVSAPVVVLSDDYADDSRTNVVPQTNAFRWRAVALMAVLVCGVLGASYFIAGTGSSVSSASESSQTPTESVADSVANVEPVEEVSSAPTTAVSEPPASIAAEPEKIKLPSSEKTVEKRTTANKSNDQNESAEKVETTDKPKTDAPSIKTPRSVPEQILRREPTRPRVANNESAPDIESIFTGRPAGQRDDAEQRNQERRRQMEEMSDAELRELRRQRGQRRRQRQNGSTIPF